MIQERYIDDLQERRTGWPGQQLPVKIIRKGFQKNIFRLRYLLFASIAGQCRKRWYQLLGLKCGEGTTLPPVFMNWPQQVIIGTYCKLERGIRFKFDGVWKEGPSISIGNDVFIGSNCEFNICLGIEVGDHSLIASGCRFIDHDHGLASNMLLNKQPGIEQKIRVGKDVWLGCNVVVLKGVQIADGAVIAAGAVVTRSVPGNEIWGGVPAQKIGRRPVL